MESLWSNFNNDTKEPQKKALEVESEKSKDGFSTRLVNFVKDFQDTNPPAVALQISKGQQKKKMQDFVEQGDSSANKNENI